MKKIFSILALLLMAVSGARAAWTGGTYTATANENLGAITVNGDATLTINSDVTVTVTGGINVASGTLTVTGPGTLVVTGAKGGDGGSGDYTGGTGGTGGVAISGNIIVQGGATVTATGGNGGKGGNGDVGGKGGNGGNAFAGTLTYKSGTVTANGGSGGSGGWGEMDEENASSGSAGKAFANDVDFTQTTGYSVTNGTSPIGSVLNQRKVVISGGTPIPTTVAVTGVTLAPTSATLTLGETETVTLIPTVLPDDATDKTVTWTTSNAAVATVANGVVTAVAPGTATITATATNGTADTSDDKTATCTVTVAEPTYTVTVKEGTEDAANWQGKAGEGEYQALPLTGLEAGTAVTVKYNGMKKVKNVKAKKKAAAWDLTAKLAYTGGEIADFTDATDDLTTMTWAEGEHIAILYEVSGTKKVADAEITAVDGTTGAATITFTVEDGTPDNTACTLVYPYSAAKDDHTGVKDAATLLANQDGTLNANLDVRVGAGTIQTTTPGLTVTTQPEAQFAIFKFTTKSVPSANGSLQNTNVTKLTVTIGAQDYVITPASATSTLYAALPAVSGQTVSFTATDGSNLYAASKASVSFDAAKYYQSTVKMGKVIEVLDEDDPYLEDFTRNPSYKYLHIGLEQAYAIARQLSTQNSGATVAVVYNNENRNVTYALSSDASATARTLRGDNLFENNYRVFLATLWEDAD